MTPPRCPNETLVSFKQALREAARDAGFDDLRQLEHKAGLSHSTVSAAFNPTRALPSEKTVHAIATAANLSTGEWLQRRRAVMANSTDPSTVAGTGQVSSDTPDTDGAERSVASRYALSPRWIVAGAAAVIVSGVTITIASLSGEGTKKAQAVEATTFTETTGTPAHTWSDPLQAGGAAGTPLGPRQSVQVSCRVRGYVVQDGDPWWYRIESPPWRGKYYATSDAFYNEGSTSGPVDTGVVVDEQVPICSS